MMLHIGNRKMIEVATLAEASQKYAAERQRTGEGCSTFPAGTIRDGTKTYRVSYNARVWVGQQLVMEAA
jgi:hypothetical protein